MCIRDRKYIPILYVLVYRKDLKLRRPPSRNSLWKKPKVWPFTFDLWGLTSLWPVQVVHDCWSHYPDTSQIVSVWGIHMAYTANAGIRISDLLVTGPAFYRLSYLASPLYRYKNIFVLYQGNEFNSVVYRLVRSWFFFDTTGLAISNGGPLNIIPWKGVQYHRAKAPVSYCIVLFYTLMLCEWVW